MSTHSRQTEKSQTVHFIPTGPTETQDNESPTKPPPQMNNPQTSKSAADLISKIIHNRTASKDTMDAEVTDSYR